MLIAVERRGVPAKSQASASHSKSRIIVSAWARRANFPGLIDHLINFFRLASDKI
jgi:hypothetical protein